MKMSELVTTPVGEVVPMNNPDQFITQAIESGSDVSVLTGLFDLKQRWEQAEAKKAFHKAMLEFQSKKPEIKKDKQGHNYKYATLQSVENCIKPILEMCELAYRWESYKDDATIGVRCVITHVQGHSESTEMSAPYDNSGSKNEVQALGSTMTYLKRYTLSGALGLTTADEDDDGASHSTPSILKLLALNKALAEIETMRVVLGIKEALAEGDYTQAAEYFAEMPEELQETLRVAYTKGGIFTVEESKIMKSNEYHAARTAYYQERNG
jgi:hypothetical protein